MKNDKNLVWIDLEMTGLDPQVNRIIEMATVVTDAHLNILATGPVLSIWQPSAHLDAMDKWNTSHHTKTGLVDRVKNSTMTEADAEAETLAFLEQYVPKGKSPICGNTVSQDRRFLFNYMPTLERFFHYRHIDISTVKELAKRWQPDLVKKFVKENKHQALDDVLESIAELCFYRDNFFKFSSVNS